MTRALMDTAVSAAAMLMATAIFTDTVQHVEKTIEKMEKVSTARWPWIGPGAFVSDERLKVSLRCTPRIKGKLC